MPSERRTDHQDGQIRDRASRRQCEPQRGDRAWLVAAARVICHAWQCSLHKRVNEMYVRWQHRKTVGPATAGYLDRTIGSPPPAALEAAARAVTSAASMRRRRPNPRSRKSSEPKTSWVAVIVESRRAGGQPRQHLIKYVASIDCADVHRLSARRRFWERADTVVAEFPPAERLRFERALEGKVRRPTVEEVAAASPAAGRARFEAMRAARAALGSGGSRVPTELLTASTSGSRTTPIREPEDRSESGGRPA
jgi:hypothetical protein